MKRELKIKKCLHCGSLIKVLVPCQDDSCGICCCNEPMKEIKANATEASFEKHIPTYIKQDKLIVTVNHVMEEDHYIEWICLVTSDMEQIVYFAPNQEVTAIFPRVEKGVLYAYCNKHGLWKQEIE